MTNKKNDKEHEHFLKVSYKFEIKTVKNYRDLYLQCYVLLLPHVFENVKNNSLKNYGLCPSRYFNAPALSWDAMLDMTQNELEFIVDPDVYIFLEKDTRGRAFYLSTRYSKTNNKYLKSMTQSKNQNMLYN